MTLPIHSYELRHTYDWVMPHIWSCHTYEYSGVIIGWQYFKSSVWYYHTCDRLSVLSRHNCDTGWRRLIGCLKLQVIFRKRATNYVALLWKMPSKDKASYDSTPPCITQSWVWHVIITQSWVRRVCSIHYKMGKIGGYFYPYAKQKRKRRQTILSSRESDITFFFWWDVTNTHAIVMSLSRLESIVCLLFLFCFA